MVKALDDFTVFKVNIRLPRTEGFRQVVDKIYWRVEGLVLAYREDFMETYYNSISKCCLLNKDTM